MTCVQKLQFRSKRSWIYLVLIGLVFPLSTPLAEAQVPIRVRMQGQPNPVRIGTLTWSILNDGQARETMTARFDFTGGWGAILDAVYDFRWFQIVNEDTDDERPTWNGSQPDVPYVDPPSGGWDYERGPNNEPGADASPYYEDDAGFGGPWDFNNHHTEGQNSRFEDTPGTDVGEHIVFKTFLVAVRHGSNTITPGRREFVKLAGFSWRLDGGDRQDISKLGQIDPSREKQKMMQALANVGFQGWNTIQLNNYTFVPEPASVMVLSAGLAGLVLRRKRRSA